MSWDGYVDNLIASGVITRGAIIGLNGAIWTPASAPGGKILSVSQAEATAIAGVMSKKDSSVESAFAASGVTIEGVKYMFLRDMDKDGKMITAKKVQVGNLVLCSSGQAIVIAFIPEEKGDAARSATTHVENIVKYLEGAGY